MTSLSLTPDAAPIWTPSPGTAGEAALSVLFRVLARLPGTPAADAPYEAWHRWSVQQPEAFWGTIAGLADLIVEPRAGGLPPWDAVLRGGDRMAPPDPVAGPTWFPGLRLNYAEHCVRRDDDGVAVLAWTERGEPRSLTWRQLRAGVAALAASLRALGVQPGDRVGGVLPNGPEAVLAALATSAIGAVWSSCSPDFGARGILDRFEQVAPRVLFVTDGYEYNGKPVETLARAREVASRLPALTRVVLVPGTGGGASLPADPAWERWADTMARGAGAALHCARLPFDHPLFVMYSSGTTGKPKAMVHGQGGTLLQHVKEHRLHVDLRVDDRLFYFTTCGWMMWNWLLSALASGVTIVLYDGAPLPAAEPGRLWDVAVRSGVTVFGTSAKYLALSQKAGLAPARTHRLPALKAILSTGSPLAEHSFDYVARDVKPGVQLASISGGTDLISCFALGNPTLPVWRGELQCLGLGMAVEVWDEQGRPVVEAPGELVCTRPFPSMPVAFWDDPDGAKYRAAYFEHFPGVWRHGDWAVRTAHGGLRILGRSDATLNPGGVRIGTAEIYRQVEQLPEVLESVVIGQDVPDGDGGTDVRVVLFVRLRDGVALDDALADRIRRQVREGASPHHVPRVILPVADLPRTISGKISELAVREVVHGRPVRNTDALANPESLALFRGIL